MPLPSLPRAPLSVWSRTWTLVAYVALAANALAWTIVGRDVFAWRAGAWAIPLWFAFSLAALVALLPATVLLGRLLPSWGTLGPALVALGWAVVSLFDDDWWADDIPSLLFVAFVGFAVLELLLLVGAIWNLSVTIDA